MIPAVPNKHSKQSITSLLSQNHIFYVQMHEAKIAEKAKVFIKNLKFLSTYPHLKSVNTRAAMKVKLSTTATSTWSLTPSITESLSSFKLWTSAWWLAITALKCKKKYIYTYIKTYVHRHFKHNYRQYVKRIVIVRRKELYKKKECIHFYQILSLL